MRKYTRKNMIAAMLLSSVTTAALVLGIAGNSLIDAQSSYNCDVNNDGKVNVTDLNIMKRELLKVPVSPPSDKYMDECRVVINSVYNQLAAASSGKYSEKDEAGDTWIMEMGQKYKYNIMSSTGYAFTDLNNDGKKELVIGEIEDKEKNTGSSLGMIYTKDDTGTTVKPLAEGWSRKSLAVLEDNSVLVMGSSGAMYSNITQYTVDHDKNELVCTGNLFTAPSKDDETKMLYYKDETGECDPARAEILDMTSEEYAGTVEELSKSKKEIEFTPFTEIEDFSIFYVERGRRFPISLMYGYRDEVDKDNNTIFMTLDDITDFRLYDAPYGEDLSEHNIYSFKSMKAGYAIDAGLDYIGDMPNIAYSYIDRKGVFHAYYVEISGYDGSIYSREINDETILSSIRPAAEEQK